MTANRKKYFECCMDPDVKRDLEELAHQEHRTISEMAEFFLKRGVGHLAQRMIGVEREILEKVEDGD